MSDTFIVWTRTPGQPWAPVLTTTSAGSALVRARELRDADDAPVHIRITDSTDPDAKPLAQWVRGRTLVVDSSFADAVTMDAVRRKRELRQLDPIADVVTEPRVLDACEIAHRVRSAPREFLSETVTLADAVLRLRNHVLATAPGLGHGSRIRMSMRLLRDLYERNDEHESATVRIARIERDGDDVAVLVLVPSGAAVHS